MAVVNASQAVISSLAQAPIGVAVAPNPIGIASLALALSSGAASIAAIARTTFDSGVGSAGGGGGGAGGGGQPPAFNVVGASETDQLADAIGGQSQRPARAYVVSNDVTTAQELDRNIIEGSSI